MIPGPITGHVPIDPGTPQRQLTEAPSEAGADAGTSFADLLASMLAPGAVGAQLQPPASKSPEAVFERLDAAEIFNETGLFQGAAPLPSEDALRPAGPAAWPVAPEAVAEAGPAVAVPAAKAAASPAVPGSTAAAPPRSKADVQPLAPPARTVPQDLEPPAVAAAPADGDGPPVTVGPARAAPRTAHGAMPSIRGQAVALRGGPTESAAAGNEPAGGGRVASRTAAMVAQLLAARAGSTAAQVSVQAAEGGISVMARVDKLTREERDRLRGEIGELLARHGFAGAEIVLNGEAEPPPQGKEE